MQIEISEETYRAIAATHTDVALFVEKATRQALEKNRQTINSHFDADQVLAEFRDLEGLFGSANLEEVLADRRCGIE